MPKEIMDLINALGSPLASIIMAVYIIWKYDSKLKNVEDNSKASLTIQEQQVETLDTVKEILKENKTLQEQNKDLIKEMKMFLELKLK